MLTILIVLYRWFVGLKLGAHTYGMLGRLVSSLINLKATSPAIALLQLVPNGYAIASRIYYLVWHSSWFH